MRLERRFDIGDRLERLHGRPPRERVIQDIEVTIERCADFVGWFLENVPIHPIWLCPIRLRDTEGWPLYPLRPGQTYVNVGFWSTVPVGATEGEANRMIERRVSELDGHKSLYSDAFYTREEFDALYGGEEYRAVKRRYDPDSRLLDLYAKAVQRR
jgi:FAD/FMN-containing dehydrogenase